MKKVWEDSAWNDYLFWQKNDKNNLKKINHLIATIERQGKAGKSELLKGNLSGYASARINSEHRLVYKISGDGENRVLIIAQCKNHY